MRAPLLPMLLLVACQGLRSQVDSGAAHLELPVGWATCPPSVFEQEVDDLAGRDPFAWSAPALDRLASALAAQDGTSVRAAVLLAHSTGEHATRVLIERLEARAEAPTRGLDAGDLVAAAALDGRGGDDDVPQRLAALVVGAPPHPDLEVRVECARSALRHGREEVAPFLLTVLRALTPAEREHPGDWERVETMMWAKSRAGEALSDWLGVEARVRPDGSWADQMAEADRLEALAARTR